MSNNVKENYILLEIEGKHLESAYSVYIIEVNNKENNKESKYYYIGQTGDSQYITARSPLRRLMGHLTDIKSSTQNQVFNPNSVLLGSLYLFFQIIPLFF